MAHQLSSTTLKVLNVLNDCSVHTGSDIAAELGISRTAVWKIIQRLKKYNIDIQSQHQGYQLTSPLILLDKKKIEILIEKQDIFLEIFETVSSTSDYLKSKAPSTHINVCLAEHQSKGRGRLGRPWVSPFGRNIYCSSRYLFKKDISELSGLSLVVGILTAQALKSLYPKVTPLLKWPNDIYMNGHKIGGVLIDLIAETNGNCAAIISVGLNVNMKDIDQGYIDQPWTSLEHILNEKIDRNIVIAPLIRLLLSGMEIFHEKGIDPFLVEWKQLDLLENKKISIHTATNVISGISRGINSQGNLRLELSDGTIEIFSYGDTKLAKALT